MAFAPTGTIRLLPPLSHDPDNAQVKIDSIRIQSHQLTDTDPAGVEKLQDGTIPQLRFPRFFLLRREIPSTGRPHPR